MTPRIAATFLAAPFLNFLLAGCGNDPGGGVPERDASAAIVAVHASDGDRPIDVVMAEFRSATGIDYSLVSLDDVRQMPQADIYFGESFVDLWEMAEAGLFRPVAQSLNERGVADQLKDPERRFAPLATAPRAVVFNTNLVSRDEARAIGNFASLADERWKGRLCLSSYRVDGNRLLVAHLINRYDLRQAEIIVRRWLMNLAAAIHDSDAGLLAAISAGECGLGILDLRLLGSAGLPAGIDFQPFADDASRLFDISGVGISRHAASPAEAAELLEWLLTAAGSDAYTMDRPEMALGRDAIETPVDAGSKSALALAVSLAELGFQLEEADLLAQRAGYR